MSSRLAVTTGTTIRRRGIMDTGEIIMVMDTMIETRGTITIAIPIMIPMEGMGIEIMAADRKQPISASASQIVIEIISHSKMIRDRPTFLILIWAGRRSMAIRIAGGTRGLAPGRGRRQETNGTSNTPNHHSSWTTT